MKQQHTAEDAEQPVSKATPGERLRCAREELGLSLEDVASQLKLDVSRIKDLETNDASSVAAPVFLAGYLRAYARLVNLPSDELAADIDLQAKMASTPLNPAASAMNNNYGRVPDNLPSHMSMSNKSWNGLSLVASVIVVAMVVGVLWWNNQGEMEVIDNVSVLENAAPSVAKMEVEEQVTEQTNSNSVDMLNEQPAAGSESRTDSLVQDEVGLSELDVLKTDEELSTVEKDRPELSTGPLASSTEIMPEQIMPIDSVAEVEEASVAAENGLEHTQMPQEQVTFFFSQDSWVEVNDAMGQRLMYRLGKAGEIASVTGVAPFSVHLGFAPGVSVSLNGQPYDLAQYGGRRIIRFQLGGADRREGNG